MANTTGKKFGGRKKGTPNKNTALVRTFCDYMIDSGYEKFKTEMDKLEGKQYVDVFIKLTKIVVNDQDRVKANDKLSEYILERTNQTTTT